MRRSSHVVLALALLSLAAGCRDRGSAAGEGPYAEQVADAIPRIEAATHLKFKTPPKVERRSKDEVRRFLEQQFNEQAPAEQLTGEETAARLFGLIPDTLRLRPFLLDLLAEQIIGYYDPRTKVLYIVDSSDDVIAGATVDHELVHALQDQYVNLDSIQRDDADADRKLAVDAVLEGQATWIGLGLASGGGPFDPARLGGWAGVRQLIRQNHAQLPKFSAAPMFVQEQLLFPYLSGAEFVRNEHVRDSTTSPLAHFPQSTEQVLHGQTAGASATDAPIAVTLPAPRGATRVFEDVMGEFGTRLFLYEHLHDIAAAARGAAGWGGDRYMVVRTPQGEGIVWLTVWDQALDAGEFGDAAKSAIRRRFGPQRELTIPGGSEFAAGKRALRVTGGEIAGRTYVLYVDVPAGASLDVIDPRAAKLSP